MNAVKTLPDAAPPAKAGFRGGGKLVVLAIVLIACWAAAISWYFRYQTTHRAAKFWGPETAKLIRDAPQVTLYVQPFSKINPTISSAAIQAELDKSAIDISHAPGLSHLRNALVDDRSFEWPDPNEPPPNVADDIAHWCLFFNDPNNGQLAQIEFSQDCRQAARLKQRDDGIFEGTPVSTIPIASGLAEVFNEMVQQAGSLPKEPSYTPPLRIKVARPR